MHATERASKKVRPDVGHMFKVRRRKEQSERHTHPGRGALWARPGRCDLALSPRLQQCHLRRRGGALATQTASPFFLDATQGRPLTPSTYAQSCKLDTPINCLAIYIQCGQIFALILVAQKPAFTNLPSRVKNPASAPYLYLFKAAVKLGTRTIASRAMMYEDGPGAGASRRTSGGPRRTIDLVSTRNRGLAQGAKDWALPNHLQFTFNRAESA